MIDYARKPYMAEDYRKLMKNPPQKAVFDILQQYGRFEKQSEFKQPYQFKSYQVMEDSHDIPAPFVPPDQGGAPIPDDDVVEHQPEENFEDLPVEEILLLETQTWGDNTIDEYRSNTIDCLIYEAEPDTNQNGEGYIGVGKGGIANRTNRSLIQFDIKTDLEDLGVTDPENIVSAKLYFYPTSIVGTHTISVYRVFQNLVEGEVTWNSFSTGNAWNTAGCAAASDTGQDDGSYDRKATAESADSAVTINWYSLILDITDLARKWFEGTAKEYGVLLQSSNEDIGNYVLLEDREGTDKNRPYLEIDFGTGEVGVAEKPEYFLRIPPKRPATAAPSYGGVGRIRFIYTPRTFR